MTRFKNWRVRGLVKAVTKKMVVVATIAIQALVDIFELRAVLDSYRHKPACERISQEEIDRLKEIVEHTEKFTPEGDIHVLVRSHAEFHFPIYAAGGNPELERIARSLWDRSYRYRVMALSKAGRSPCFRSASAKRSWMLSGGAMPGALKNCW